MLNGHVVAEEEDVQPVAQGLLCFEPGVLAGHRDQG
jgi:hypothetical protein